MNVSPRWFAARLLFESRVDDAHTDSLYEERIILVRAGSGTNVARKKAEKVGAASSHRYENQTGADVAWLFKEVLDLVQLNDANIGEGTEVYHQYLSAEEVEHVRQSLKSGSL